VVAQTQLSAHDARFANAGCAVAREVTVKASVNDAPRTQSFARAVERFIGRERCTPQLRDRAVVADSPARKGEPHNYDPGGNRLRERDSLSDQPSERRQFGATGLMVSPLGMGCGRLGSRPTPTDLRKATQAVSLALARGINFFDTADAYGRGLSERIIGRAIARRRDEVVVATKCGLLKTPSSLMRAALSSGEDRLTQTSRMALFKETLNSRKCYDRQYVMRSAEASLRRLNTDHIDVFLLHSPPRAVIENGDFVGAMEALQSSGKIRSWGISVAQCDDAFAAIELPGIAAIEVPLNICEPEAQTRVIPAAVAKGVALIARQPLGSGTLEQRRREFAAAGDGEREQFTARYVRELSLRFVLAMKEVATCIVGMTKPEHVAANVAAATTAELSTDELATFRRALCDPA
jgi:aryl-alcohol dehydrogenase-like predicted oxidoreductase